MKTLFGLAVALLITSSCGRTVKQSEAPMQEKLTYLALGDSYTIGEGVSPSDRWPVLFSEALNKAGLPAYPPLIIAETGWTTDELMRGIDQAHISPPFDLVSLLIGVNNQYRGRDSEEFRMEFNTLLTTALKYAGGMPGHVIVLSIPDWGVTPFAEGRDREKIAAEITAFNQVQREETKKLGIPFIDITGISRMAADDSTLLAGDGLHPSGKMYGLWVEKLMPEIIDTLK